jgi:initiation factor 1A
MPKNVGGGKNYKKRKAKAPIGAGPMIYPDDEQMYGIVAKRFGNGWVELVSCDNEGSNVKRVLGRIRGILRKKRVRFMEGSYVIACGRDFEASSTEKQKVDIVHKYHEDHVRILNKEGVIPMTMKKQVAEFESSEATEDDLKTSFEFIGEEEENTRETEEDVSIDDL